MCCRYARDRLYCKAEVVHLLQATSRDVVSIITALLTRFKLTRFKATKVVISCVRVDYTKTFRATGLYRAIQALRCRVIGRWAVETDWISAMAMVSVPKLGQKSVSVRFWFRLTKVRPSYVSYITTTEFRPPAETAQCHRCSAINKLADRHIADSHAEDYFEKPMGGSWQPGANSRCQRRRRTFTVRTGTGIISQRITLVTIDRLYAFWHCSQYACLFA